MRPADLTTADLTTAVVTIAAGRHRHLAAQRRALRELRPAPDLHVVVALGDPAIAGVLESVAAPGDPHTLLVRVAAGPDGLPLAAGRNAGARAALDAGADLLVFLDVDCLPAPQLLDRYAAAAARHPGALLCGPVTYLPPRPGPWTRDELRAARDPHPARPDPPDGTCPPGEDPALFWSLSFALTATAWTTAGGFDEGYVGYGAEDTDFARRAREADVGLRWVGGADAYHQHHPTSSPPLQHVDAILRNGARYARRWGEWPMTGWLEAFRERGVVRRAGDGWVRAEPLRVADVPAAHPYVDAVRPAAVVPVDVDGRAGAHPDPLLAPAGLRALAPHADVVHLHFGYEHLTPEELERWVAQLHELRLPLVLTVHDLRNPHLPDNTRHEQHLRTLLAAAAEVITLTASAADEIATRYGRRPDVLAHPTLLGADAPPTPPAPAVPTVAVPLGVLRRNVVDPAALVRAAAAGAAAAGGRALVSVRRPADADPRLHGVRAQADAGDLDLLVHDRFTDDELVAHVGASHALVLPYRFGTHSGWLELARDTGTAVVAPSCGHYAGQWDAALTYGHDETRGLDAASLSAAVRTALSAPRPQPAERSERLAERDRTRAELEVVLRRAAAR